MGFLAVEVNLIPHGGHIIEGEGLIMNLNFLQADDVRLLCVYQSLKLMQSGTQAIDIKRDYLHCVRFGRWGGLSMEGLQLVLQFDLPFGLRAI